MSKRSGSDITGVSVVQMVSSKVFSSLPSVVSWVSKPAMIDTGTEIQSTSQRNKILDDFVENLCGLQQEGPTPSVCSLKSEESTCIIIAHLVPISNVRSCQTFTF
jgi:hypothetical protein